MSCLLVGLLAIGVAWWWTGRETADPIPAFKDERAARTYLKSQEAAGKMTQVEAQLRLAEAISSIQKRQRKDSWRKAYTEKIRQIMDEQGISEEEAQAILKDKLKNKKGAKISNSTVRNKQPHDATNSK